MRRVVHHNDRVFARRIRFGTANLKRQHGSVRPVFRHFANKIAGVTKRERGQRSGGARTPSASGFVATSAANGKRYFVNESLGLASRTRVTTIEALLKTKAMRSSTKRTSGWLLFRAAKNTSGTMDLKQLGKAWNQLSEEEKEMYNQDAAAINNAGAAAPEAALVTPSAAGSAGAVKVGEVDEDEASAESESDSEASSESDSGSDADSDSSEDDDA